MNDKPHPSAYITSESKSEVAQSCPILCDPVDGSPPSSSVHGILQARTLEWDAISSSRGSSRPADGTHVSYVSFVDRQGCFFFFLPLAPPGNP